MSRHTFSRRAESHPGHRSVAGGLARAAVFGVSDGLVSNVSLVIGFAGAGVDSSLVRLAGIAGAIAGATSMAAGEWVSISAQNELVFRELAVERRELKHNSVSETAELADPAPCDRSIILPIGVIPPHTSHSRYGTMTTSPRCSRIFCSRSFPFRTSP